MHARPQVLDWLEAGGYQLREEVQVLTPMKRGLSGTFELNRRLKERLNPLVAAEVAASPASAEAIGSASYADDYADERSRRAMQKSEWFANANARVAQERAAQKGRRRRDPPAASDAGGGASAVADRGGARAAAGSAVEPPAERADAEAFPRAGDSMIQLTNDYATQVFNGDVGRVTRVWSEGKAWRFSVSFQVADGRGGGGVAPGRARPRELIVDYTRSSLGKDITLSYALTVHKAQGSEYPVVIMPLLPSHSKMLYRNLLYTGLSRAKQLLVFVGSHDALRRAVENDVSARRITLLAERVDDRNFAPPVTRHMSDA